MIHGVFDEFYEVTFEIYIADKLAGQQIMQAPQEILILNFIQTAKQIQNDQRPMKIRMLRPDVIWDNFENRQKVLNNEVSASNNAMIAWEENNGREGA